MGGGGILPPESKVIICSLESSRVLIVTRPPSWMALSVQCLPEMETALAVGAKRGPRHRPLMKEIV